MPHFLDSNITIPESRRGDPAWELAMLFPPQGEWTETDYYQLETTKFIELVGGCIEVLPMPTWLHQRIVRWLSRRFEDWTIQNSRGEALFAPLPLKVFAGTIREPDILIVERPAAEESLSSYPPTALLVVEVISEGAKARHRDLVEKPSDYARAKIPEYWIVDPQEKEVIVLTLEGTEYTEHGRFTVGQTASSIELTDFVVNTDDIWSLENQA